MFLFRREDMARLPPLSLAQILKHQQMRSSSSGNRFLMNLFAEKKKEKGEKEGVGYVQQAENLVPDLFVSLCAKKGKEVV